MHNKSLELDSVPTVSKSETVEPLFNNSKNDFNTSSLEKNSNKYTFFINKNSDNSLINNNNELGTNGKSHINSNSDNLLINKEIEKSSINELGTNPNSNTNVLQDNNALWTKTENSIKPPMQNDNIVHNSILSEDDTKIINNISNYIKNNETIFNTSKLSNDDVDVISKSLKYSNDLNKPINETDELLDVIQYSNSSQKLNNELNAAMPHNQAIKNTDELYNSGAGNNKSLFPETIDYKNLENGRNASKINKPLDNKTSNSIIKNVTSFIKNHISYKSRLNNHQNYLENREQMFKDINNGYDEIINIFRSLNELSVPVRKQLHEYLTGDNINVPASVKSLGDSFRKQINLLGEQAVENGLLSRAAYDEWKNIYLYRTYDKTLRNSIKKVLSKITNKNLLKDKSIQAELKTLNPAGVYKKLVEKGENKETASIIARRIKELLASRGEFYIGTADDYKLLLENGRIGKLSDGKISAYKNSDGTYTFRRDYSKQERQSMGEITDGALTVARTMQKLNDMINVGKFLKYIENNIVDDAVSSKDFVILKGSQFGALNGHKIPKDIANDLESISNSLFGYNNDIINLYQKYLRVWKKSVSIYNVPTHVSNVMSNITLMLMGGFPAHKTIPFIFKGSATLKGYEKYKLLESKKITGVITDKELLALNKLANNKNIQTCLLAEKHGLFGSNRFHEVMQNSQELSNNLVKGQGNFFKRNTRKVLSKFENAFLMEDNAAKITMFDYLINNKKWPVDEAIKEINKITPDYNAPMHKMFRALRDTGVVPFISWTYYTFPTILKQLNPLGKNKVGQGLNKYNSYNMLKIIGTLSIADYILTSNTSIYDEQPPIFNNKRMPVYEDYDGNVTTLKIDKWIPHLSVFDPAEFFLSQAGSGIPQKLISNLLLDSDPYFRNQITWNKGLHGAADRAEYYIENYVPIPRFVYSTADVAKTSLLDEETRRKSPFLNPRTPTESILTALGFNTLSYNKDRYKAYLDKKYRMKKD